MDQVKFQKLLKEKVAYIEQNIPKFLPEKVFFQNTILEAMSYSLLGGGKRLRPLIIMETYRMFGGEDVEHVALPFMAAMEMIHTYSLVHDDLPAMDNDEYRRGRKTTHIVYGEDMGILAGDALLNFAYETASASLLDGHCIECKAKALNVLSTKAGIFGMVGGQVVDVEKTGKPLTKEEMEFIYRLKTGALLEASFMIGAILAGASNQNVEQMEKVGQNVGMAFQIQDDILDITSTTEVFGKPVHSDEKNEKTTYVSVYGLEKAKQAVEQYSEQAMNILTDISENHEFLMALTKTLIKRKK